ncbi:nitroreductase [Geotalea sp. SG265]|uniref:nitroreductase family protein n=1 Tax=Geotalea sp. SG265 TaxID=2922867 RepID=UPI001FAFE4A0|nr:nitroreductase [Geotalea sp. SG265]
MELLEGIYSRRSVRSYTDQVPATEQVLEIVKAGSWAPSGLNNQPWRFVIVRDPEIRRQLAGFTRYRHIIDGAPVAIAVFCDRSVMYNDVKDHQAMGACLQNMLLAAHGLGLGAVWLGEILKSAEQVGRLLRVSSQMELMAVVTVGYPAETDQRSARKDVQELILAEL